VNVSQTGTGVQTLLGGAWMEDGATGCITGVKKHDNISLQLKLLAPDNCLEVNNIYRWLNTTIPANVKELRVESYFRHSYSVFSPRVAVDVRERLGLMQGEQ
jgi:hypothetical protein